MKKSIWAQRYTYFLLILILMLIVAGYFTYSWPGQGYREVLPRIGPIVESIYGVGTIRAHKTYTYRLGVSKIIKDILVEEGDKVKSRTSLIIMDDGMRIKAPFDGTVTSISYHENELTFPQTPIISIEDLSELYILASIDQHGIMRVKKGMKVSISFENIRNEQFFGEIERVYPRNNEFFVHVHVNNLPSQILTGMTADIAIEVASRTKAFLIPTLAITSGSVLIKRDGKRMRVNIQVGSMDDQWAEVTSDNLKVTDLILVRKI